MRNIKVGLLRPGDVFYHPVSGSAVRLVRSIVFPADPAHPVYRVQCWHWHLWPACTWRACPGRSCWSPPVTTSIGVLRPDMFVTPAVSGVYDDPDTAAAD